MPSTTFPQLLDETKASDGYKEICEDFGNKAQDPAPGPTTTTLPQHIVLRKEEDIENDVPKRKLIAMLNCALGFRADIDKWLDNDTPCDICPSFAAGLDPRNKIMDTLMKEVQLAKKPTATKAKTPRSSTKTTDNGSNKENANETATEDKQKPSTKKARVTARTATAKDPKKLGWIEPIKGKDISPGKAFPPGLSKEYCFNFMCVGQECKAGDDCPRKHAALPFIKEADRDKMLDHLAEKKICHICNVYKSNPRIKYTPKQLELFNTVTDDEASTTGASD